MKKARLFAIGMFLLSLNACQAPTQQLTPEASKKLAYSRQVTDAMKAYTKDSFEGLRQNPQLLSLGSSGSAQSVPSGASSLVSTFSVPSSNPGGMPKPVASKAPASQAEALQEALKMLDLLKKLLQASDKALQGTEAKIKVLSPPAEMAAKHTKLLDYFRLGHELCQDMLKLFDKGPAAAAEMVEAQAKFKARAEELDTLGKQSLTFLYELLMSGYRQDRIALQQGPALSRDAYILKMRTLLPKLPASIDNPNRLFSEAQTGGPATESPLAEMAALHPPEDFEESHTALYAGLRLHQELTKKLQGVFASDAEAKNLTQKPIEMMIKLLGDAEISGKLLEFSTIVPQAQEAADRVVRG